MEKHIICGLLIAPGLLAFTGLVITAVRRQFHWSSFYLGLELVLAGLADGLINFVERLHAADGHPVDGTLVGNMAWYVLFAVFSIGALFVVVVIHQRWDYFLDHEQYRALRIKRGVWLGVIANGMGIAVLTTFIYLRLEDIL